MNTFRNLVLFLLAGAVMAGCNKVSYRKTAGGMPYKVYPGSGGKAIHAGYFVKVNLTQKIKDSTYFTTEGKLPIYLRVNDIAQPYDISEVWIKVKTGDSIVTTQVMDTFIRRALTNPQSRVPPQFKNGDRIETFVKILDVFTSDTIVRADEEKSRKEFLATEIKQVEKYLADKKITAVKSPSGAFVQYIEPGTGDSVKAGKTVTINYTGTSLSGVKFDSNVDTNFHHTEPYSFVAGTGRMVKGFDEAILMLRKGSVAKIYIPSLLAFGANAGPPNVKPFEHVMFDVTLVDIKDTPVEAVPNVQLPPTQRIQKGKPKK